MGQQFERRQVSFRTALLALLVLLFAFSPSVNAAACAAEDAGAYSIDAGLTLDTVTAADDAGLGCGDEQCQCAICHCCHAVSVLTALTANLAPDATDREPPAATKRLVSTAPHGFERPPRV